MTIESQYIDLLTDLVIANNDKSLAAREDRTGTGTVSSFGAVLRHDFIDGFPLLTSKRVHRKSIIHELLWIVSGSTNVKYLQDNGVRIWNEWADENGDLGPVYGKQMRDCGGVDQLTDVIDSIVLNPMSRRHIISLWHPPDIERMRLPPCHGNIIQFYVRGGYLDIMTHQRSADLFLGVPFNLASYGALLCMVAEVTGLTPGKMIYTFGDAHIYMNHIEQCKQQIRNFEEEAYDFPVLRFGRKIESIDDFKYEDFNIEGYKSWGRIKAEVSV